MFGFFGGFGGPGGGRFEGHYRVYPVTFIDKPEAERGDKIFLPPSALDRLAQLHVEYPMLFEVENRRDGRRTHCGVLEFIAEEGMAYLPYWMMQNLLLQEGDVVTLRSATLPKGTFTKLQPHSKDFLDISNPRAVLETSLRNFSCLTVGDTIPIHYNNKVYYIDIVEARPSEAVSVIETDCQVDFAPPLDYVEPDYAAAKVATQASQATVTGPEPMATEGPAAAGSGTSAAAAEGGGEAFAEPQVPKFLAFTGSGRRLDGKPASESRPVAIPLPSGLRPSTSGTEPAAGSAPKSGSVPRKSGKLMFKDRLAAKYGDGNKNKGGSAAAAPPAPKPQDDSEKKDEEESFKSFSGKAYSLKG
jgi:ubiquitin fusion degradation protein 1